MYGILIFLLKVKNDMEPDLIPVVPDYLSDDQEELSQEEDLNENLDQEAPEESEEDLEQTSIDYTQYFETLVSNQETIIFNQESLEVKIDDLNNQINYLSSNNNLLLNVVFVALIVFCGFWITKKIFLSFF